MKKFHTVKVPDDRVWLFSFGKFYSKTVWKKQKRFETHSILKQNKNAVIISVRELMPKKGFSKDRLCGKGF